MALTHKKHLLILSLTTLIIASCVNPVVIGGKPPGFENEYQEEHDTLSRWQEMNYYRLIKKYNIQEASFDAETIYELEDLSRVISLILDSTHQIEYSLINEFYDSQSKKYKAVYEIKHQEFTFETSALGDFIDFEKNYELLKEIASLNESDHIFALSSYPEDQSMTIVYASKDSLKKAINEGFPLTLDECEWK